MLVPSRDVSWCTCTSRRSIFALVGSARSRDDSTFSIAASFEPSKRLTTTSPSTYHPRLFLCFSLVTFSRFQSLRSVTWNMETARRVRSETSISARTDSDPSARLSAAIEA